MFVCIDTHICIHVRTRLYVCVYQYIVIGSGYPEGASLGRNSDDDINVLVQVLLSRPESVGARARLGCPCSMQVGLRALTAELSTSGATSPTSVPN